jgi:hypothetical protein
VSEISEHIKSRGYWEDTIRPFPRAEERVPCEDLEDLIVTRAVRLRGWPLPYVPSNEPILRGSNWIGADHSWDMHKESWRFFQSGQFAQLLAFRQDWRDESEWHPASAEWHVGDKIQVAEILFHLTELYEFAARLALTDAGGDEVVVDTVLHGLRERRLVVDDPGRAELRHRTATVDEIAVKLELSREELIGNTRSLAVRKAREVYLRFGWNADEKLIADYQTSLLSR